MRNRQNHIPALFIAAFIVGVALVGQRTVKAAASASTSANATALIVRAITITSNRDLDFGEAAQGTGAKTVLPAAGTSARFVVAGEGAHAYNITLPNTATMLVAGGTPGTAADEIAVNTFTSTPSGSSTLSGIAGGAGGETVTVGANRAAIPESQTPGVYTTSFSVTVAYP
jgi:hypothetical protein